MFNSESKLSKKNLPELLSDVDDDGLCTFTDGGCGIAISGSRGAIGLNFFAGLKKLQKAHLNAAYSYSS